MTRLAVYIDAIDEAAGQRSSTVDGAAVVLEGI